MFVGGSIVPLLLTDPAAPEPRPTTDVDIAVEVATYVETIQFESALRRLGFEPDTEQIQRFNKGRLQLDVVPINDVHIQQPNPWYAPGWANSIEAEVGSIMIRHLDGPHFVATKLVALADRGGDDVSSSHDFEDIVHIINGRQELLAEVARSSVDLKRFLSDRFGKLTHADYFEEVIESNLTKAGEPGARTHLVLERVREIMEASG